MRATAVTALQLTLCPHAGTRCLHPSMGKPGALLSVLALLALAVRVADGQVRCMLPFACMPCVSPVSQVAGLALLARSARLRLACCLPAPASWRKSEGCGASISAVKRILRAGAGRCGCRRGHGHRGCRHAAAGRGRRQRGRPRAAGRVCDVAAGQPRAWRHGAVLGFADTGGPTSGSAGSQSEPACWLRRAAHCTSGKRCLRPDRAST